MKQSAVVEFGPVTETAHRPEELSRPALWAGLGGLLLLAAGALLWAKWLPYASKLHTVASTDSYPGSSILDSAGKPGDVPSLSAGWEFLRSYGTAVWQALVAGLVIAAALDAFLPRQWLGGALRDRRGWGTLRPGLLSMPTMMCTCCSAPIAATMKRTGVPSRAALAFWLGNPLLNPVVLVFLAILLPWQWVSVRLLVGTALVFVLPALLARGGDEDGAIAALADRGHPLRPSSAVLGFGRSLLRLSLTLVPEYILIVFAVGALRGWLFPLDGWAADWQPLVLLLAAAVGTLIVVPTAGEIPILLGLIALGVGAGPLGALLVTLPAVSAPSMAMVARAFGARLVLATAGAVCLAGVVSGTLLWALGG
jgi:uncharacterized protein